MRLHQRIASLIGVMTLALVSGRAVAQTATQTVTFSVVSMSRATVSGTARPITVRRSVADQLPTSASVGGSSYAIATNESNQKIAASLDHPLPSGVSLAVSLAAPAGAASTGSTVMGTASSDVVTGISAVSAAALPIVYTLSASHPVASSRRVVTFTVTAGT